MKFFPRFLSLLLLTILPISAQDSTHWEKDIAAFETADVASKPAKGGILFTGSSSIRLWETLANDFPDHSVINRGFGGACLYDVVHFFDRIVTPYAPKCVVLFAGTNDIASGRTPAQVAEDFLRFTQKMQEKVPGVPLLYISITSSPSRWEQRDKVVESNALIQKIIPNVKGATFVEFQSKLLGTDGQPRPELFVEDRLHLSAEGYRILAETLRPLLPKP